EQAANGYRAVRVADDDGPAIEMSVAASELAMKRATVDPGDIELIAHASVGHQGLDHFAPASYVQTKTVGGKGVALEIKQHSNGGLACLELGAAYLTARSERSAALLTTSDKFIPPAYDRYRSDRGILFGDGGTALVLSRRSGVAELLSTAVYSDGTYGAVYIGDEPWTDGTANGDKPIDLRARREQYLANNAAMLLKVVKSTTEMQRRSVQTALDDAGVTCDDITRWVFMNVGLTQVDVQFRRTFRVDPARTVWEWGREVGHIGAGDQYAGLAHLLESGQVRSGDLVLMTGMGMGFSYGSAVVRILDEPGWPDSTS
ncbi:ketoacyl-ACP synthase III family protein, partial [Actinomadura adrarensis]